MTDLILEPVSTIATPDAFEQEGGSVSNVTRLAHLVAGVTMFLDFPLGVGLGGFPFHYANYVPEWALWSPEVQSFLGRATTVLIPEIALPTPKSMLPKILSETGILGGALFSWFFFSMFRNALRAATTSREPEVRYLAFASVYALVGIVSFSFNSDSFVMPHYYFVFAVAGLVGGMSLASNAGKVRKPPSAA
jgi:O-antigen ligase